MKRSSKAVRFRMGVGALVRRVARFPGLVLRGLIDRAVGRAARRKFLSWIGTGSTGGWWPIIRESFAGAWQTNTLALRTQDSPLRSSAVFACVTLIASDLAKLPLRLMRQNPKYAHVWGDWTRSADIDGAGDIGGLLRRPNGFQTPQQFLTSWVNSLQLTGNAYVLIVRDLPAGGWATETMQSAAAAPSALIVLDPSRVMPLVSDSGEVFYELHPDNLSGLTQTVRVPAEWVIHDRINTLFHPLIGISPLWASALAAGLSVTALTDSTTFFQNASRPGGVMTAPGPISDETAERLKATFTEEFTGDNAGNLLVLGDGLKYEALGLSHEASQLAELLGWSSTDIARAFKVPPHMIAAGPIPPGISLPAIVQNYFSTTLQPLVESIEALLDHGLALPANLRTELDIDALLRMDQTARYEAYGKAITGGWLAPNEARKREGLAPVAGGDTPYLQQQNFSLEALSKRDQREDPFAATSGTDKAASLEADTRARAIRLEEHRAMRATLAERHSAGGPAADGEAGSGGGYFTRAVTLPAGPAPGDKPATRRSKILARRRAAMRALFANDDEGGPQ